MSQLPIGSPWKETNAARRSHLEAVPETGPHPNPRQSPFRADANTFRPRTATTTSILMLDPSEPLPRSPYYPVPHVPFLPPDTPSAPDTPPPETEAANGRSPVANRTYQPASTDSSPVKVGDLFHGLGSIWAAVPNELNYAHSRGRSEVAPKSLTTIYDAARPRSRSEVPAPVATVQASNPYSPPYSGPASKRDSTNSSASQVSELVEPSPLRQNPRVLSAMANDVAGRDTPGGVMLPRCLNSPSPSSVIPAAKAANAKAFADFIKSGGMEEGPLGGRLPPGRNSNMVLGSRESGPMQIPRLPQGAVHMDAESRVVALPDPLVQQWKNKGGPNLADVFQNLAFFERARAAQPPNNYGVVHLGDIPYTVKKPEIVALIGEKAPMAQMPRGAGTYAIHIIMERGTAKSMDAYVEFETPAAALQLVARLDGARPVIGHRRVRVSASSQEALMRDLFPRAKCVRWEGSQPVIYRSMDPFTAGFQGFVSSEELVMTVKVAQNPSRSRYAGKHQQRTYESMISLMFKYPWSAVDYYTLFERDLIFKAVLDQLITLTDKLRRNGSFPPVDTLLLQELLDAGLKCPGFSESQRARLIDSVEGRAEARAYVTPIAHHWPFEVLARKDGLSDEFVLYFISLLRNASAPPVTSLAQMSAMNGSGGGTQAQNPIFGHFKVPWPPKKGEMTMAAAAKLEWDTVEHVLRSILKE